MAYTLLGGYTLAYILFIFLALCQSRFGHAKTAIYSLCIIGICTTLMFFSMEAGISVTFSCILFLTLPAGLLLLVQAKHRGTKYIFTFVTSALLGLILITLSLIINATCDLAPYCSLGWAMILSTPVIITIIRIRATYNDIQEHVSEHWAGLAFLAVMMYSILVFLIGYLEPIRKRSGYLPIFLISMMILCVYIVLYRFILNIKNNYDHEKKEEMMQFQLQVQEIQILEKEMYHKMAYTDALTGLQNRMAFTERIKQENVFRINEAYLAYSFDMDNLKQINDHLGQGEGDKAIKAFASILAETFGDNNDVFRMGGDEFWVLQSYDPTKENTDYSMQFMKLVNQYNAANEVKISASVGIASSTEFPETMPTEALLMQLFTLADKRMYENKNRAKLARNIG